jgi:hypothetical protein
VFELEEKEYLKNITGDEYMIMNNSITKLLSRFPFLRNQFVLNGELIDDRLVYDHFYGKWTFFYYERGERSDYMEFHSEVERDEHLLNHLIRSLKQFHHIDEDEIKNAIQ